MKSFPNEGRALTFEKPTLQKSPLAVAAVLGGWRNACKSTPTKRPQTPSTSGYIFVFTMAGPEGGPNESSETSERQQETHNASGSDDNGGRQMTLSSDEVNYLIFRYVGASPLT
mgnify:CR=1 FL=1